MKIKNIFLITLLFLFISCNKQIEKNQQTFYLGGDFSFVNEMLDRGAKYRYNGKIVNPYQLFGDMGANISRIRLWHSPEWNNGYSGFDDVELAIKKSKEAGMHVMLNFHYSDTWADPQHQVIPKAWEKIENIDILSDSLYNYTYQTLQSLHEKNLTPEFVQVGNEVNIEIMQDSDSMEVNKIDWSRNLNLLNSGIKAVNDFSDKNSIAIETMIHIAQPENALWWYAEAEKFGISDYDWIGLSYYPKWSAYGLDSLGIVLDSLLSKYDRNLMIVETAYPHTLDNADSAGNILGQDAVIDGYPPTPKGQYEFINKLIEITRQSGGLGVVYWEPAWVISEYDSLLNKGSSWDNSTFFDALNGNEALEIFKIFNNVN